MFNACLRGRFVAVPWEAGLLATVAAGQPSLEVHCMAQWETQEVHVLHLIGRCGHEGVVCCVLGPPA